MRDRARRDAGRALRVRGRARWGGVVVLVVVVAVVSLRGDGGPASGRATGGEGMSWVVTFDEEADLAPASRIEDRDRRGRAVFDALTRTAAGSRGRAAVVDTLDALGHPHTDLWIANALSFTGPRELADVLANAPGVAEVVGTEVFSLGSARAEGFTRVPAPVGPTATIAAIGASTVHDSGVDGRGIVVGVVDTGVDVMHPDLGGHWRADHGWYDALGECGAPCDASGHGTHVTGLVVGPETGAAPGARWIAARGCLDRRCTLDPVVGALQFMLAPTAPDGGDPRPELRPHVLNSSWTMRSSSLALGRAVRALDAAAVVMTAAAGNDGPACGTLGFPSDQPEVLAVVALDRAGVITESSARGSGSEAPALAAPGVDAVSTVTGGGYGTASGTSVAAPLVAGTAALALQVSGDPSDVEPRAWLAASARGAPTRACDSRGVPNAVYGAGILDAVAAVEVAARRTP